MEKENDMTTFTEDQIKKIRETLGDEAVAKLTLPKVRVPKYVSGQWLADHAQIGVTVSDSDGDTATYCEDGNWDDYGYSPLAHSTRVFAIEEWPNGEIYDNCPPPERAGITENTEASGGGELKVGDVIESVEQLDSLPCGSIVAHDDYFPFCKENGGRWVKHFEDGPMSSLQVFNRSWSIKPTVLRVGW